VAEAAQNHHWRQKETINLIPSETTPSLLVRLLTILDPSGRYAEHREMKAFRDQEIFYYQGTKLIGEVEALLKEELKKFMECFEVSPRHQRETMQPYSAVWSIPQPMDRRLNPPIRSDEPPSGQRPSQRPIHGCLEEYVAHDPATERWLTQSSPSGGRLTD
jgi:aminomethyltransferase